MGLSADCVASIYSVFCIPAIRGVRCIERSVGLGEVRAADSEVLVIVSSSTVALVGSDGYE